MRRLSLVISILVMGVATPASAQFVGNRSDWIALGPARQADYAMGLMDGFQVAGPQDRIGQIVMVAQFDCLREQRINNVGLSRLIDEGYAEDAATWRDPPVAILLRQLIKICGELMDQRLREAGFDGLSTVR